MGSLGLLSLDFLPPFFLRPLTPLLVDEPTFPEGFPLGLLSDDDFDNTLLAESAPPDFLSIFTLSDDFAASRSSDLPTQLFPHFSGKDGPTGLLGKSN